MTDGDAGELAKSCLMALLANDLGAVAFTDTLRRGLQKWLDEPGVHLTAPNQVDWQTVSLIEKCRFPGLEAFLFRVNVPDGVREVLVGVDEANWVTEFAFVGILHTTPERRRESFFMHVIGHNNPWFHVKSSSTSHNLQGLIPFDLIGSGSGGNRNDSNPVHFYVKVLPESWEALVFKERERILSGLERIALNDYWLDSHEWGSKERIHVAVIKSEDHRNDITYTSVAYAGSPPQELVLAERFVDIPKSYN